MFYRQNGFSSNVLLILIQSGIHPWFLHEYLLETNSTKSSNGYISANKDYVCEEEWYKELKKRLQSQPDAIVGEIGLDGARWVEVDDDENDDTETTQAAMLDSQETNNNKYIKDKSKESIWNRKRVLACPMDLQRKAFENQLYLATELQRPVSIHVVRAWGELFDSFDTVRERMKQKYIVEDAQYLHDETVEQLSKREKPPKRLLLPPKIYFHAFSGKEGVLPSLLSACAKGNIDPVDDVYFGFPPAIPNFYAPKTPSIMRKIGINQSLIETDLEDASCAWGDLITGAEFIANALDLDVAEVASRTYANAENFYFGSAK